jgi:penicillin-binding protein 1A
VRAWQWLGAGALAALFVALLGLAVLAWDLPRPATALDATRRPGITVLAADGSFAGRQGEHYGEILRARDAPAHLIQAVLATEDRRFRDHWGLDLFGILRALWVNVTAGRVVQGGSTITQQVAKTLFLTNERSWRRKGQEALLALWLERAFDKDAILSIWLNRVYLGAGTYGMDAAARLYFGVPARSVSVWQAAVLAGLPKAPSRVNPRADPDAAILRAREVVGNMVEAGYLTPAAADRVAAQGAREKFRAAPDAGWFAAFAAESVSDQVPAGGDVLLRGTLDARLQAIAESRLAAALAQYPEIEGAVVAIEAGTGAIRALVGGAEGPGGGFNRAVAARRQSGSAFKPVVWLAALEQGAAPGDVLDDRPITIGNWSPRNFNDRYAGRISVADALAQSSNSVAVQLFQRVGARRVGEAARRLGLSAPANDATAALGTGHATPLALAAAYAAIANGGIAVEPFAVATIAERTGRAVWRREAQAPRRVIEARHAAELTTMLRGAVETGTGRAAAIPGRTVAGKTGTTSDSRDAWFVGWTDGLVVAVWIGADDNRALPGLAGGGLPARLFHEIVSATGARSSR